MKYKYKIDNKNQRQKELDSIKNLYNLGSRSKAMAEVVRFIEKYPEDMYGHHLYASWLFNCSEYEAAKEEYEIVYRSDAKNRYSSLVAIGEIEEVLGNEAKAKKCYEEAINDSPYLEKRAILLLASQERKNKNYERAIAIAQMLGPEDKDGLLEIAKNLVLQNEPEKAKIFLMNITPTTEKEAREINLEKGKIAKIQEDYALANLYLQNASTSDKKDKIYYASIFEQAKVYIKTEQFQEAINICEELILEGKIYSDEVHLILGIARQGAKDYKCAMDSYKKAAESLDNETSATASYYLGVLQLTIGDTENAKISIRDSISKTNDFYIIRYTILLKILLKENRIKEAKSLLKRLKKIDSRAIKNKDIYIAQLLLDLAQEKNISLENLGYTERQLIQYNSAEALQHITKRHTTKQKDKSRFNPNINVQELFENIQSQLVEENKITKSILDEYCIDYPESGYFKDEITDYIFVVTVPGTKNIINMYPSTTGKFPRRKEVEESIMVATNRTKSRTNKFYEKYGLNNLRKRTNQ